MKAIVAISLLILSTVSVVATEQTFNLNDINNQDEKGKDSI
jgi:hypothetical protein